MTATEYTATVEKFFMTEGIEILSSNDEEPGFSWVPCDCCKRPEGGDRYNAAGARAGVGVIAEDYSICTDCLVYVTNGDLPELA